MDEIARNIAFHIMTKHKHLWMISMWTCPFQVTACGHARLQGDIHRDIENMAYGTVMYTVLRYKKASPFTWLRRRARVDVDGAVVLSNHSYNP